MSILTDTLMDALKDLKPQNSLALANGMVYASGCGCTGNCGQSCVGGCEASCEDSCRAGCTNNCGRSCSGSCS